MRATHAPSERIRGKWLNSSLKVFNTMSFCGIIRQRFLLTALFFAS